MLLARLILILQLLALAGLGLAYFIQPHQMTNLSGMLLMAPAAVTDVRAYYGGLQLGLAAFIGLSLVRHDLIRAALAGCFSRLRQALTTQLQGVGFSADIDAVAVLVAGPGIFG